MDEELSLYCNVSGRFMITFFLMMNSKPVKINTYMPKNNSSLCLSPELHRIRRCGELKELYPPPTLLTACQSL